MPMMRYLVAVVLVVALAAEAHHLASMSVEGWGLGELIVGGRRFLDESSGASA
jgi:hypothetical protein